MVFEPGAPKLTKHTAEESGPQRLQRALLDAAMGVSRAQGQQLFDDLVMSAARTLDVDFAFIALVEDEAWLNAYTIAFYDRGKPGENFHYGLSGTPCQTVLGKEFRFYASGVQHQFSDHHAKALQVEGYAGVPLFDSKGAAIGLLAVMSRRSIQDEALFESILRIFADRSAAEVERSRIEELRLQREEALRKSEERLRATVAAALDCIIGMDSDGNIIEFNPAAEKCFGYSRNQVLGRSLAEAIIPQRMRGGHEAGMQRYLTTGAGPYLGKRVEVVAMRSDGSEFPAELTIGVARDPSGHMFIGYLRDLSRAKRAENERTQLEAQLRQAQKMEAIGHLTGGIAHDFNNILTGILGYIDMAQERCGDGSDLKLMKYLDRSKHAAQRARDLIQQMLTFSRGQRGTPRPIDFRQVVGESVKLLESSLPSTIELKMQIDQDLPAVVMDPVHLEQVIVNLCINARDAMEGKGSLVLTVRSIDCDETCVCASCRAPMRGRGIAISVKDSGPGISPDLLERIFEPFFTTKEVGKGSGMGLATVHGIVHEYSGHISVDSLAGKGTTFTILLPTALETSSETAESEPLESDRVVAKVKGRVLLVDDDDTAREFMVDLLESWGLDVEQYASPADALAKLGNVENPYNLAIVDYTMPGIAGTQLAKKLIERFPDLPVVLYTGFGDQLSEDEVASTGIRALVRKPIDNASFEKLTMELLQGPLSYTTPVTKQ